MSEERQLLKRITAELLARNPVWCVIVGKRDWLCPYCGEIGAEGLSMEDQLELLILQHLVTGCDAFSGLDTPTLPLQKLKKRAEVLTLLRRVARRLERDPVWQVRDGSGAWICPFCARSSGVELELPDEISDPSSSRASGPDVAGVVKHLLGCERYRHGKGKPRPLEELLGRRERAQRERLRKRLERKVREQPVWRFRDMDHHWLCPFCAEPTEIPFDRHAPPDAKLLDAIWQHLEGCEAHQRSEGKPHTERFLKDRVIAINQALVRAKLERKLRRRAIWQFTDADDNWLCPYCATFTEVKLPDPRRHGVSQAAVNAAWDHLSSCSHYAAKRAKLRPKAELRKIVEAQNCQIRLRREVARALVEDERWSVSDAYGSWLCPYCRKVQKSISLQRSDTPLQKMVLQVVTHLLEQCPHYTEGAEPRGDRAELEALVRPAEVPAVAKPSSTRTGGHVEGGEPVSPVRHGPEGARKSAAARLSPAATPQWIEQVLHDHIAELKSKVELSLEMQRSLEQARNRQLRLLPRVPEVEGFEFGVAYRPCSRVGGDFYDFVQVSENELGVAVGDISGHGIEAALLVGLAKKLLEVHGRGRSSPGQALFFANEDIYPDLDARTFVTVLYGVLNTRSRRFRFARAGHNPLLLFNPERKPRLRVIDCKGMALGMVQGEEFVRSLEDVEIPLRRGDLLFMYTDGVTEAMNHDGEEFGAERLHQVICRYGAEEAEYVLYQIEKALDDFREGARQHDDITMVAIKVIS